jgi:HNH endonuclease
VSELDDLLTERLLRVLGEGRRTATYKLALLHGLIEAAALAPGQDKVSTRAVAEQVLTAYYPQTRPYIARDGVETELRQISSKGSPLLRAVLALREAGSAANGRSIADIKRKLPDEYHRALDTIERTLVSEPIPRLQIVGSQLIPFLYKPDWEQNTSLNALRSEGRDHIRFLPGVADRLVILGPLLRPLIEMEWARDVAHWTKIALEDETLKNHLFGSERATFPPRLVAGLRELQSGACFYCQRPLVGRGQVDHFLPWSRWPNDSAENLVLADECNGFKSDHLVTEQHLDRWLDRRHMGHELRSLAESTSWLSDPIRTEALIRTTYGHIAPGTPLWVHGTEFEQATGPLMSLTG